jgi:hypothetical protein
VVPRKETANLQRQEHNRRGDRARLHELYRRPDDQVRHKIFSAPLLYRRFDGGRALGSTTCRARFSRWFGDLIERAVEEAGAAKKACRRTAECEALYK